MDDSCVARLETWNVFFSSPMIRLKPLDTPGHADFSEDTYRALAAADNALMLLDAAKGLEGQTRKLFAVCRLRGLPVFTFVNKMDRPAMEPMGIMDEIEGELGLEAHPVTWPVGDGDRFRGLVDRVGGRLHLYGKSEKRGGRSGALVIPVGERGRVEEAIGDRELSDKL